MLFLRLAPLCDFCWKKLGGLADNHLKLVNHIPSFFVFNYKSKNADIVKSLLVAYKGGGFSSSVERLLCDYIVTRSFPLKSIHYIVPAPLSSRNTDGVDHAREIASALNKITGIPILNICQPSLSLVKQKYKSQKERKSLEVFLKFKPPKLDGVCFVDDVITTGSTMISTYKALGKPKNFVAVSLFYQALLST